MTSYKELLWKRIDEGCECGCEQCRILERAAAWDHPETVARQKAKIDRLRRELNGTDDLSQRTLIDLIIQFLLKREKLAGELSRIEPWSWPDHYYLEMMEEADLMYDNIETVDRLIEILQKAKEDSYLKRERANSDAVRRRRACVRTLYHEHSAMMGKGLHLKICKELDRRGLPVPNGKAWAGVSGWEKAYRDDTRLRGNIQKMFSTDAKDALIIKCAKLDLEDSSLPQRLEEAGFRAWTEAYRDKAYRKEVEALLT